MRRDLVLLFILMMVSPVMGAQANGTLYSYCGDQNLFFRNDSSDITGYKILDHIPELAGTQSINVSVSQATGTKTLGKFIMPNGSPNVTTLAPGLWRFRTYLYTSSTSGTTTYRYIPFVRYPNGTEDDIFYGQIITSDVNALVGSPTEYLNSYARRNYTSFTPNGRLGIMVNVSTTSSATRVASMSLAGNTEASMVSIGYFECPGVTDVDLPDVDASQNGGSGDASGAAFGLVGGLVGAILAVSYLKERRE